mmetsp:Transcript_37390/g.38073  ORF Transcript_37390/g.38073 Transcript_37390/m.38073 type:complete len:177 (+) Transcript_37390:278-808(+)
MFQCDNSRNSNESDELYTTVRIPPTGLRFINGISSSYSETYPPELTGVITGPEYHDIIKRLNDTLSLYWPCTTCYIFGFACVPCTCGTSLLCPAKCISASEEKGQKLLEQVGFRDKFYQRKIFFRIEKRCFTSWLEIKFPSHLKSDKFIDIDDSKLVTSEPNIESVELISDKNKSS